MWERVQLLLTRRIRLDQIAGMQRESLYSFPTYRRFLMSLQHTVFDNNILAQCIQLYSMMSDRRAVDNELYACSKILSLSSNPILYSKDLSHSDDSFEYPQHKV